DGQKERGPIVISCSFLGFGQEGEDHVECGDQEQLQEAVHPEEFVAIADYSATDQTQLSFLRGEKILILRQTTADWWWGERAGCCGYIPANHLGKHLEECDPEDTWQDEEYFGSYGTLVLLSTFTVRLARWWFPLSGFKFTSAGLLLFMV
ncbi:protein arginine N-methyltransferase 2-like, partial [Ailuropoda melanoleuca]|uniref:protein arginine N-methyltransferase 2-like n=1 Tax=Ailuropoda melanoleuca TaxID=9646 RepID=UPI0014943ED8